MIHRVVRGYRRSIMAGIQVNDIVEHFDVRITNSSTRNNRILIRGDLKHGRPSFQNNYRLPMLTSSYIVVQQAHKPELVHPRLYIPLERARSRAGLQRHLRHGRWPGPGLATTLPDSLHCRPDEMLCLRSRCLPNRRNQQGSWNPRSIRRPRSPCHELSQFP